MVATGHDGDPLGVPGVDQSALQPDAPGDHGIRTPDPSVIMESPRTGQARARSATARSIGGGRHTGWQKCPSRKEVGTKASDRPESANRCGSASRDHLLTATRVHGRSMITVVAHADSMITGG